MEAGITSTITETVTSSQTASAVGSGTLEVFATPMVAALVERCAWTSIQTFLDDDQTTVGTKLSLDHIAPTPVGCSVTCNTVLTAIDRRKLSFSFTVTDSDGPIAQGTHERFIVDSHKFMEKATQKIKEEAQ